MKKLLISLLISIGLLVGCANSEPAKTISDFSSIEDFYQQTITWKKCGLFQCGEIYVPIDYQDLSLGVFRLSLTRDPANQTQKRIGSLIVNPGGPGGSGIGFAQGGQATASISVLNRFDIVGFDPRGVGESEPISCLTDAETDQFLSIDETPDTEKEIAYWNQWVERFAKSCQEKNPDTWRHIGSWNVARDMDVLRAALGEQKLNLLGKSYGTLLGALYAELFPDRVGRMVLDGAVDPDVDFDQNLTQIKSFELTLNRFISNCLSELGCPLDGPLDNAYQQLIDFLAALDEQPLRGPDGRVLTESHATTAILIGLYDDEEFWPYLKMVLGDALEGDGQFMLFLSDLANSRGGNGKYQDNSLAALYAVNCVDYGDSLSPTELPNEVQRLTEASRFFAPLFGWGSSACLGWKGKNLETVRRVNATPTQPILIIGTTYDPATPIAWTYSLSKQISNSVVLEWVGDGHTAYRRGSLCVDGIVNEYLIFGTLPKNGEICPAIRRR